MVKIQYQAEPSLSPDEFIDILQRSTLAQRRPVGQAETIRGMLANADLIITARLEHAGGGRLLEQPAERARQPDCSHDLAAAGQLVGVSRAITDFSYCTYLSDLAVDVAYQRQGIGRELIRQTHQAAGMQTTLILLSAPQAETYYPHIGMRQHHACWIR